MAFGLSVFIVYQLPLCSKNLDKALPMVGGQFHRNDGCEPSGDNSIENWRCLGLNVGYGILNLGGI